MKARDATTIDTRADPRRAVNKAVEVLRAGGLVVAPTETVYGLIADAGNPQAVAKLYSIKRRDPAKPFAFLIADPRDLENFAESTPEPAKKLAQRYWPGPLTLVLDGKGGEQLGLRVPGNDITRNIIRRSGLRIHGTSANRSAQPPALTAQHAADELGSSVNLILDAGPSPLGQPSTVVKVSHSSWEVLRPGAIDEDKIEFLVNKIILFLCSGNSCRSPMAEGICRTLLSRKLGTPEHRLKNRGYTILSAGITAAKGDAAAEEALIAMRQLGIHIDAHKSRPLTADLAKRADLIFVMDSSLLTSPRQMRLGPSNALALLAGVRHKTRLLGKGISDPYGGSVAQYAACANQLMHTISSALNDILA